MNGRKLSAALTALPENLVAEAMEPGCNGRSFSWLRLAVCAVIVLGLFVGFWPTQPEIVTAPGLLTVTVYAMDEEYKSVILEKGVAFPYSQGWSQGTNVVPGLPISLNYVGSEDNIHFNISVDGGRVFRAGIISQVLGYPDQIDDPRTEFPSDFSIGNPVTLYWRGYAFNDSGDFDIAGNESYLDIIIYDDGMIIGYSVVKIQRVFDEITGLPKAFYAMLLESVYFPDIDGMHQNVSLNYVQWQIEEVKAEI